MNSAPRKANIKRAASNKRASVVSSSSNKRAASSSSSSSASSKRAANTSARARRQAGVGNPNTSSQSSSVSSSASTSVSGNSCPVVDTETLNNILAEIKSLKDMLASGNVSVNTSASTSANTSSTTSSSNTTSKTTTTASTSNTSTGKIFKSSEITLNAGQGYTLSDIVNESNLSKYDTTRFYFSKCGFVGGFKIPREECIGKNSSDCSLQPYVGTGGASSQGYVLSEMDDKPSTSYNISNAFNPFYAVGKYYKAGSALYPSVYIRYKDSAAKKCPSYNFVKAITNNGTEELLKINIKANPINGTSGDFNFTGKVFANPTLKLKEGVTYKLKDIMNFPYGSNDIYGNNVSRLYVWVSSCGMDKYNGRRLVNGYLVDNQTSRGYSSVSGNGDDTIVAYTKEEYNNAYIKVLEGAKDKCKTNFIMVSSGTPLSPDVLYSDATKIEFVSNSSSVATTSTTKTTTSTTTTRSYSGGCSGGSVAYYVGGCGGAVRYYVGGCGGR
ncbi:hypothetical protein HDR60_00715 [bacterium]|nr:hypothetical protein [bacterium]